MKIVQRLLPFNIEGAIQDPTAILPGEIHTWQEFPQLMFKPMGILFWGATDQTYIKSVRCGNSHEVAVGGVDNIPARYFEAGKSFEEMKKLAELGELELSIPQRQIISMSTLEIGNSVSITTSGPFKNFCMWGKTPDGYGPLPQEVVIEKSGAEFKASVSQLTLDGPQELLVIRAPTSEDCAIIIAGSRPRGRF
jgi:hypothetical protein